MTFNRVEYLTSEMMGPPEALVIDGSGSARYESHTNLAVEGALPVGTYATTLTASQISGLAAALENPPFRDIPDQWGQIASGERYKLIRVTGETGTIEKRIGTARPAAASMQKLIGRLDRIVQEVRSHPLGNLELSLKDPRSGQGGGLESSIIFANPGTLPVIVPDPTSSPRLPGVHLSVRGRPDREPSQIHSADIIEAEVDRAEAEGPVSRIGVGLLEIAPGATITFRIGATAKIPPGAPYVFQALYQNTTQERDGREAMVVEVYSRPVKLK